MPPMNDCRPLRLRRHPRHPAGRLLPRADAREAPGRGLASTSSPAAAQDGTRTTSACRTASTSSTCACSRASSRELEQERRPRAAHRVDLGLLRLGQVELRQAPGPRARRHRAARRTSLAEACSAATTRPRSDELRDAWTALRTKVEPIAVVFDIGGVARDDEHIHSAALRQLQKRLGLLLRPSRWSPTSSSRLERRRRVGALPGARPKKTLGQPWAGGEGQGARRRTSSRS